jgi:nitroreductase
VSGSDETSVPVGVDAPILDVMATMRAMRRLKPDPIPDHLLERLVAAATWAPSGSDLQSYEFVVVTQRQLMSRLAELWGRSVDAYLASIGRATPATRDVKVRRAVQFQREHFHETPALIVACYRSSAPRLDTAPPPVRGASPARSPPPCPQLGEDQPPSRRRVRLPRRPEPLASRTCSRAGRGDDGLAPDA